MKFTGTTFLLFLSSQSCCLTSIVAFTLDPARRTKRQISTRDDKTLPSSPLILHSNMAFDNFDMPDDNNNNNNNFNNAYLMTDEINEIDLLIRETDLAIDEVDELIRRAESADITTKIGAVKEGATGFGIGLAISMALAVAMIHPTATNNIKTSVAHRTTTSIVREQKRVIPVTSRPSTPVEVTPPAATTTTTTTAAAAPPREALVSPLARYMTALSSSTRQTRPTTLSSSRLATVLVPSLALTAAAAAFLATRPPPSLSSTTDDNATTTDALSSDTDAPSSSLAPPPGIPLIYKWKHHPNGSISGFVQQSKLHDDGDYVITSPVGSGDVTEGMVVTTASGSRYFLAGR